MKIKDREEFEDAQAMARIAVERTNNSIPEDAFWNAAMQALISAYAQANDRTAENGKPQA